MKAARPKRHGAFVAAPDEGGAKPKRHGAAVAAPDEGGARANSDPPDTAPGFFGTAWSLAKLLAGVMIVVAASAAVAWGAHHYALTSPRFSVRTIELYGLKKKSEAQVAELGGLQVGKNIFAVDTSQVEQKLLGDPWISDVKVTRALPSTLRVELTERDAGALAAVGDRLYLVTKMGEPFKPLGEGDPFDLPVVSGVAPEDIARDRARAIERIALGLEILRHWERIALSHVHPAQEAHLGPAGDASLTVGKAAITIHLGKGPWRKKMLMAERVVSQLSQKGKLPGIVFADNQAHPERVVVRMK